MILSICIPVWNGEALIGRVLESIVAQDTEGVEVIVSDNCSTDRTQYVTEAWAEKYPSIKYVRMPEHSTFGEDNWVNAMNHATGDYIKLLNSNFMVKDGVLRKLVDLIQREKRDRTVIFCRNDYNNGRPFITEGYGFDWFIEDVSYNSTWMGGFGIWKDKFNPERFLEKKETILCQVDMLQDMIGGERFIIVNPYLFDLIPIKKSARYNIAEVFGTNYLGLIKPHILHETYEKEKIKVLDYILAYHFNKSGYFDYNRDSFFKYMKEYRNDDYFYERMDKILGEMK